jgi:hypothetical protein
MSILGIRTDSTTGAQAREVPNCLPPPGVIISGSCSDSTFVPAKIFICADTLTAEVAIRAWLEAHGIRVST